MVKDPIGHYRLSKPPPLASTHLWASSLLSREEQRALEEAVSSKRSVAAGSYLLSEGETINSLFLIIKGWAYRFMVTTNRSIQIPNLLVSGDIANLNSLMPARNNFGIRTLSETTFVTLELNTVSALAAQHFGIARTLARLAFIENSVLGKWALCVGHRPARERLAHLLCELSARLDAEDGNTSSFAFPLTQEQIANVLGLTSIHVNRILRWLCKEGLVAIENRMIALSDVARLRQIGEFDPSYLHLESSGD